ncbi:hypothetical protein E2562_002980 [Oryza meyeriana var. granulata]|uniref:Uncharacterized protein n=1 Tax=Oryza meyeriana var. granulata TaxID=110450 RepID=A0A6G1DDG5_9ORYZ|nr:hypothetical protein E2562_002980 [Oryza meyeriana var. granulata]
MNLPKRVLLQGSPRGSPEATRRRDTESDDNVRAWSQSPRHVLAEWAASSPERKKVLGERNSEGDGRGAATPPPPQSQAKPATSPPSLSGRGEGAYDPKTNYTTPRPEFLRYNPEKRREILLRLEREAEDESSSATSGTPAVSESVSSASSARGEETERDGANNVEEEEEEVPAHRSGLARRLFLLLVAMVCTYCYIYCMNSSPFRASEMGLNFAGPTGSVHDVASVHQLDSLGLQIAHQQSEDAVQLYGPRCSPKNFMAIAAMGLADACPNVTFGEFTCQTGDIGIENAQESSEDYQLSEQAPEVIVIPSENVEQSREVASLDGNVIGDSIGTTYTADMEGEPVLVHQEEQEDHLHHSQQLASMEKVLEQENEVVDDGEGLEGDKLDRATEPWEEYADTAEAAKAVLAMVKSLWSSMKLHLMEMLPCLSVAAFVVALLKYFKRSPKGASVSTRRPEQAPALAPNPILPVFPSPQSVQQPLQLIVPKVEPPVSLEVPLLSPSHKPDLVASLKETEQLPRPKAEPSVNLDIPVQFSLPKQIGCGNRLQKIQQDDADNAVGRREIDSSRPPVVALLGEFSLVDASSSRGSSRNGSNDHAGDVPVQESSVTLRNDVVKMQKESSTIKSPSARRTKKEVEKMDAAPTPLRRSNRLLNRVTSP